MPCDQNARHGERLIRLIAGLGFLALAALSREAPGLGLIAGLVGLMLTLNGLLGGCPVCTIARKQIDKGAER